MREFTLSNQDTNLSKKKLTDEELKQIALDLINNAVVKKLRLNENTLSREVAVAITHTLKLNKTLQNIDLSNCKIDDDIVDILSKGFSQSESLLAISLRGNNISRHGASKLATTLLENNRIETLDLADNQIGFEGAVSLAHALEENSGLLTLEMSGNIVGDKGAKELASMLTCNKTLQCLGLGRNRIESDGAHALAQGLEDNRQLRSLRLDANSIGDTGAEALAESLNSNNPLNELILSDNNFGRRGIEALVKTLKENPRINKLCFCPSNLAHDSLCRDKKYIVYLDLLEAVSEGDEMRVRRHLLELNPFQFNLNDIEERVKASGGDLSGMSMVHLAASRGHLQCLTLLIPMVNDLNNLKNGRTILHHAAQQGHLEIIKYLVGNPNFNVDIDKRTRDGQTAAILACEYGKIDVIEYLAKQGADFDLRDARHRNPFDCLREQRAFEVIDRISTIIKKRDRVKILTQRWKKWEESSNVRYRRNCVVDCNDDQNILDEIENIKRSFIAPTKLKLLHHRRFLSQEGDNFPDELLIRALLFLACIEVIASDTDISNTLQKYVQKPGPKSPLLILAYARLVRRRGEADYERMLLKHFQNTVGISESKKWMSVDESDRCSRNLHGDDDISEVTNDSAHSTKRSAVEEEYEQLKKELTPPQIEPLEELMRMVGLEDVKKIAMQLYSECLADQRMRDDGRAASVVPRALNFLFVGNPGTGKTVTAQIFTKLLEMSGARAGYKFLRMTAGEAMRKGIHQFAAEVASLTGGRKGVGPPTELILRKGMPVEVTDPYGKKYPGKVCEVNHCSKSATYDVIYADTTIEEKIPRNRITAIGESKNLGGVLFIDEAYDLDPGNCQVGKAILDEVMSVAEEFRDTVSIILAGYRDDIESKLVSFNAGMASRFRYVRFEDFNEAQLAEIWRNNCREKGFRCDESVVKVASRRLGRGIGRKGFGNARDARSLFDSCVSYAKMRYGKEDTIPTIIIEDVIGKRPSRAENKELDSALSDLERLIGMGAVKKSVNQLVTTAEANYDKELRGEPVDLITLNRLFIGNPGTGKTTVASIYGRILKSLRYLSDGDLVLKVASDFTGDHIGESQKKTRGLLDLAQGKVLFIDEAYALDDKFYGKQVLDTLVEKVQATPGANIAVIMAGYKQQMLKMLRDQNPGLSSRFDPKFAIEFEDFDDDELLEILSKCVARGTVQMPIEVKMHAVTELGKRRSVPNFGNARAVETLVANAKTRRETRLLEFPESSKEFVISDVDPDLEDQDPVKAIAELKKFGSVTKELEDLGLIVTQVLREGGSLNGIINHFVFTGSPGTGKTTVARLLARVLFAYGIMATKNVVETSAMDLIGPYVGHSRKQTTEKLEEARGGVLFIDEAYYLSKSSFSTEVMGVLLHYLTKPEYMDGKTVVVLAGYQSDMDKLLSSNEGLRSRFTTYVNFEDLSHEKCFEIVKDYLKASKPLSFEFDPDQFVQCRELLLDGFEKLIKRPGWANGRDALEMAKKIVKQRTLRVAKATSQGQRQIQNRYVAMIDVKCATEVFLESRPDKPLPKQNAYCDFSLYQGPFQHQQQWHQHQQQWHQHQNNQSSYNENYRNNSRPTQDYPPDDKADDWQQFDDPNKGDEEQNSDMEYENELKEKLAQIKDKVYRDALKKELERHQETRKRANRARAQEKKRILERERKRQAILRKLATMGKCPAGFVWNRYGDGFRCAGGSHFLSASDLNISKEDMDELFRTDTQ